MLAKRQSAIGSLVCVGFDPVINRIPNCLTERTLLSAVEEWMTRIAMAVAPYSSMIKPNLAHWEAIPGGIEVLRKIIASVRREFPGMPFFIDAKRGDIGRTQRHYAEACFNYIGGDGMNFSPYMGRDCMEALIDQKNRGKALVGLCYTSNPAARQVQNALMHDGRPSWEHYAGWILQWAEDFDVVENAGLVMAAAHEEPKGSGFIYFEHLTRCREIVGDKLWFLIPGVGTQGGFVAPTVRTAFCGWGSIAINSSSEIIFASDGVDYAEAAAQKAKELRDQINDAIPR